MLLMDKIKRLDKVRNRLGLIIRNILSCSNNCVYKLNISKLNLTEWISYDR